MPSVVMFVAVLMVLAVFFHLPPGGDDASVG
jgi:hypothetical protein